MKTSVFFLIMAFSSGLTLLRGFAVAAVLDPAAFGTYATVIATGAFFGIFISFGSIEATWKHFPRLWAQGHQQDVTQQSHAVDRSITMRIAGLLLIGVVLAAVFADVDMVIIVCAIVSFAFATAVVSSGSSFLRASGNLTALGRGTLVRTLTAVGCAVAGAWFFGWPGAVAGELIGAGVFWLFVEHHRRNARDVIGSPSAEQEAKPTTAAGGVPLYLAGLLIAVPLYLDRFFVREAIGQEAIGTYGFLMLFNMGAATVVGIVVQKVGPQVIRLGVADDGAGTPVAYAGKWIFLVCVTILSVMCVASVLILIGPAAPLAVKYGVTLPMLAALSCLCMTQAFVLLDWVLMERGQESLILRNAIVLVLLVCVSGGAVIWFNLGILEVIILLAATKCLHIALQLSVVMRRPGR